VFLFSSSTEHFPTFSLGFCRFCCVVRMSSSGFEPGGDDERTRLLQNRPDSPNYRSHDRTNPSSASAIVSAEDDYSESIASSFDSPPNKISRADLIWVLAGLWSAVFLGALDGPFPLADHLGHRHQLLNLQNRNHRRYSLDADWKLLRKVKPGVVHRHLVSSVHMLLHAVVWSVCILLAEVIMH
jgi:hypothetical protein